jgi:ParB family chromosome partitioning protein
MGPGPRSFIVRRQGRIEIDYYGTEDLNRLLALMGVEEESFG